jgi:hypothetical protein
MRNLIIVCGLSLGIVAFAATDASACGWKAKTASNPTPNQTVMAPQTPAPKPTNDG